jgi:ribosomal protein S18 acetylase RimI-like enzyme
MDVEIRSARDEDEPELARLDRATWSSVVSPAPAPAHGEPFFAAGREQEDVLVAQADGEVVGYVLVSHGHPIPSHAHVMDLRGLAVSPSHQGAGIGRRLVDAALTECARRGARRVRSQVLATNPASLAVHRALGFEVEGVARREFVIDGEHVDNVLLACWLDE